MGEEAFSKIMKRVYESVSSLGSYRILTMETQSINSRHVMFEKHLISKNLIEHPNYSAVILSDDEQISIMLNEEDHIRAQCIIDGFDLQLCYKKLSKIDDKILVDCDIAYDKKWGFLTACPTNVGTGMRASVMLFLPALCMLGQEGIMQESVQRLGLTVRGVTGEGSKAEGCMFQISNQVTLGLNEEQIIEKVENVVNQICELEQKARKQLVVSNEAQIKNICFRAFGTLSNSYTMTSSEFADLIAKVKLGVALDFFEFKNKDLLRSISKIVKPYTLMEISKKNLNEIERDIFRAEYLRRTLKGALKE